MRITKKYLRDEVRILRNRFTGLCADLHCGRLKAEWERCFQGSTGIELSEGEMLRQLLLDSLERAFPTHIIE